MNKKYNIIIFNGGRGAINIINELKKKNNVNIYSIVNAYDDGKSTGNLRDIFNILGPSDIRKVQNLFIPKDKYYNQIIKLFNLRISKISKEDFFQEIKNFIDNKKNEIFGVKLTNKKIKKFININLIFFYDYLIKNKAKYNKLIVEDMSLINCIYASSIIQNKNKISKSINDFNKVFNLSNSTYCISDDIRYLCAIEKPNKIYYTEEQIVQKRSNSNIEEIFLLRKKISNDNFKKLSFKNKREFLIKNSAPPKTNPLILKLIKKADFILYAPGTQHSSLYPTYKHRNLADNIKKNKKAKKIFITNIGADYETPNYDTFDYINGAFKYLSSKKNNYKFEDFFNYILINNSKNRKNKNYVNHNTRKFNNINSNLISDNFESKIYKGKHDGKKISKFIESLF